MHHRHLDKEENLENVSHGYVKRSTWLSSIFNFAMKAFCDLGDFGIYKTDLCIYMSLHFKHSWFEFLNFSKLV